MSNKNKALELLRKADIIQIDCGPFLGDIDIDFDDEAKEVYIDGSEMNEGVYFFSYADLANADVENNCIEAMDSDGDTHMIHCFEIKECTL